MNLVHLWDAVEYPHIGNSCFEAADTPDRFGMRRMSFT